MKNSISLPESVQQILDRFQQHGYEAYVVGGCIRDVLLHQTPSDWDFCTSANPDEILQCFADCKTIAVGKAYGTICVNWKSVWYEITTFRTESEYADYRRPSQVTFTTSLYEDLKRRDFTINAMAYHPQTGILDPFDGKLDLEKRIIRCVGNPEDRFQEDALRILRALRFASAYACSLSQETNDAVFHHVNLLDSVAKERMCVEWTKLLCGSSCAVILQRYAAVVAHQFPTLQETIQNAPEWQAICERVAHVLPIPSIRWAAFCSVLGENAIGLLQQLRFSKQDQKSILRLVRLCQQPVLAEQSDLLRKMHQYGKEAVGDWLQMQLTSFSNQETVLQAIAQYKKIIADQICYTIKDMQICGNDLLAIGIPNGPAIGTCLNQLLEAVICGRVHNQRAELLQYAEAHYASSDTPNLMKY